jgi:hypothetical protein
MAVASDRPRHHLAFHRASIGEALTQALPLQDAQFELGDVQPGAVLSL